MSLHFERILSVGDWVYEGDAISRTQDEDQNIISSETVDVDGGKVGDAAQFSAGLGIDIELAKVSLLILM